jgi:hypothetical protein
MHFARAFGPMPRIGLAFDENFRIAIEINEINEINREKPSHATGSFRRS